MKHKNSSLINLRRKSFPSPKKPLLTLKEYEDIALKIIYKNTSGSLKTKLLNDEEDLSYIIEEIIFADITNTGNKHWYRQYRAKNAIIRILKYQKKKTPQPIHERIKDKSPNPFESACYHDMIDFFKKKLSPRESVIFEQYFLEKETLKEVATHHQITFQRVHMIIEDIKKVLQRTEYNLL